MTDAISNAAPAATETARDTGPLSVDDAAARLEGFVDIEPEEKAPAGDAIKAETDAKPAEDGAEAGKDPEPDPDDWDAPEAVEAEASEAEAEQAEADDQSQSDLGRFVADNAKVRLPDGTVTTVGELRAGSMKSADYTRKTQELASQRREVEAAQAAIEQHSQVLAQQRELALAVLKARAVPEPNPADYENDPFGFAEAQRQYAQWSGEVVSVIQAQQAEQQQLSAQQDAVKAEYRQQQVGLLLEKIPALKNPAKAQAFQRELAEMAQSYGFSPEEVGGAWDHRIYLMAQDAMRGRRAAKNQTVSKEKAKDKPPVAVMQPGRRQSPQAQARIEQENRMKAVRRPGGVNTNEAAKLIEHLL